MLALPSIVALSVVAFFAYAGIMESFSRGMIVAATYKSNRPPRRDSTMEPITEPAIEQTTPINTNDNISSNEGNINVSSTLMPTLSGGLQRVDLCHVKNVIVPLSADGQPKKELTFKSVDFPFKRTNPLVCSWNVKVSDNCRRGLVTMKINERSRLSGEKGCTKGYYRVSPFMNEAKICGRINNVPSFQWYVEDQQPENVTITLKHSGLNDGYSEGLGFTLSGECVTDESHLTISKAIKSYKNWLEQLSKRATDGLTVVLPVHVPFDPIRIWETQPNVTKGPIELFHVTTTGDDSPSTNQQSNSNQTDTNTRIPNIETSTTTQLPNVFLSQIDESADPFHLPIAFHVVTDSPPLPTTTTRATTTTLQSIRSTTTVRPLFIADDDPEISLPDLNSDPLSNSFPIIRRRPLPTSKKPISKATTSQRPAPLTIFPARKRPVAQVSNDNPDEIPWLILKSPPSPDPLLSQMYRTPSTSTPRPFIPNHQDEIQQQQQRRPVIRRPLVRFPSTTVRPTSVSPLTRDPEIPWVILKSPDRKKEPSTTSVNPPKNQPTANVPTVKSRIPSATTKVPIVDDQGIPWLILKSPDPTPSDTSSEIHYPNIPSNELNKRRRQLPFPGYFISTT